MTNGDLNQIRGVVKEEINTALEPVVKKIDILWDQSIKLTEDMTEVQDRLDSHTATLKRIEEKVEHSSENTKKVNKRLIKVESNLGIVAPPELTLIS